LSKFFASPTLATNAVVAAARCPAPSPDAGSHRSSDARLDLGLDLLDLQVKLLEMLEKPIDQ
jgi:hypothetical protein